jgi:hypothetical protein
MRFGVGDAVSPFVCPLASPHLADVIFGGWLQDIQFLLIVAVRAIKL